MKKIRLILLVTFLLSLASLAAAAGEDDPIADTERCETNGDCDDGYTCNQSTLTCYNPSIYPLSLAQIIGSIMIMFIVGIGQAAGIGGGLVVVPILMSTFGFEAKKSIAVVFITIFSASILNLWQFSKQVAPKTGKPLIDYKIVLLSLPTIMVGSIFGVIFNKFLPQAVISILLYYFIIQSLTKTIPNYKKEKLKEEAENSSSTTTSHPLLDAGKQASNEYNTKLFDKTRYPMDMIKKIILITLTFLMFSLIRGGSKFESLIGIAPCGVTYHILNVSILVGSLFFVKGLIAGLVVADRLASSSLQQRSESSLDAESMQTFSFSAMKAGFIGAIVGIGGGMILIPKWLEAGISPSHITPCSISLLFLTAFNSSVQFTLSGVFTAQEIIFFSIIAFISSFLVSMPIQDYVKRKNRRSLLLLIMIGFMSTAILLFSLLTIQKIFTDFDSLISFGQFC